VARSQRDSEQLLHQQVADDPGARAVDGANGKIAAASGGTSHQQVADLGTWRMGCTLKPSETSSQRQQAAAIGQMAVGCVG
jgi:hypothetical protein